MDLARLNELFATAGLSFGAAAMFVLVVMLPARVLQKRHGYASWLLVFGLIPFFGPLCLLWSLAMSRPKTSSEVKG